MAEQDSEYLHKEPCPACGSRDNLGRYTDGHGFCFGCGHYEPPSDAPPTTTERSPRVSKGLIPIGEPTALAKRKITAKTCEKWGYTTAVLDGKPVQVANYRAPGGGDVIAQKVRFADKTFAFLGQPKEVGLYGEWLWRDGGKMVVVTEGELDALSVSQAQDNRWPVVSVPNGAQGAAKSIAKSIGWLESFDSVVFMFDNDEPGRAAAIECAAVLSPGKAKIASLPLKDASDMLVAGRTTELLDAVWGAKPYRPDGIVALSDLKDRLLESTAVGLPWPWPALTKLTYGRRYGEVYMLGAGTGVGKTDVFTQIIAQTILPKNQGGLGEAAAAFYLEQPPAETLRRVAGKVAGKRFHVPDAGWTNEELVETIDRMEKAAPLYLYNHFGSTEWEVIRSRIRFLARSLGVRHFFVDHLTALAAAAEDERKELEHLMADIAGLAQELQVCVYMISHLATPEGKPHEEGGRVMIRHFKGSRAIGFWSHFMFALERDQQAEDPVARQTTTFRILKDRYTGMGTGQTFGLRYDEETGLLSEADLDAFSASDNPFAQEGGKEF